MRDRSFSSPRIGVTPLLVVGASGIGSALLLLLALRGSVSPWLAVGVPLGLAGAVFAVDRPQWVMLLLAGLLVAEPLASVGGISLYKAFTPIVLLGLGVQYGLKRLDSIGVDLMDGLVFLWVAYNLALLPGALDGDAALHSLKRTVNVALFYVMVSRLFVEGRWRNRLVLSIVGFSVVLMLYGFVAFYGGMGVEDEFGVRRFSITGSSGSSKDADRLVEPNLLAAYLFLPLFLVVTRIGRAEGGARVVAIGSAAAIAAAIVLTYSRSAFVVMVAGLGLFALRSRIQPRHIAMAGVALVLALPLVPASYWERIHTLVAGESAAAGSLVARASLIDVGTQLFRDNPVFGIGPGNFVVASALSHYQEQAHLIGFGYVAHNLYLEVLAETGLVGFALFMSLLTLALVRIHVLTRRRPHDPLVLALELALVTFLLSSLFQSTGTKKALWLMLGLIRVLSDPIVAEAEDEREREPAARALP